MSIKRHVSRRERERKELRLRILDAAQTLFLQGGEDAVTLRGVADSVEYSATTIYLHFSNKEALLDAVCETQFAYFAQTMRRAEQVVDPVARLKDVARSYADFGLQHSDHYRLLMRRQGLPSVATNVGKIKTAFTPAGAAAAGKTGIAEDIGHAESAPPPSTGDHLQRAVFKALAAGCFKPEYRDVPLLSQILWSSLHGLVTLHSVRAQHSGVNWKPIQAVVDGCLETLLNGMLAPAHQLPVTWQR